MTTGSCVGAVQCADGELLTVVKLVQGHCGDGGDTQGSLRGRVQ